MFSGGKRDVQARKDIYDYGLNYGPDFFEYLVNFDEHVANNAGEMLLTMSQRTNAFKGMALNGSEKSYSDAFSGAVQSMNALAPIARDISKLFKTEWKGVGMLRLISNASYAGAFHSKNGDPIEEAYLAYGRIALFDSKEELPTRKRMSEDLILNPLIDQLPFIPDTEMGRGVEFLVLMDHLSRAGYVEKLINGKELRDIGSALGEWYSDISEITKNATSIDRLIEIEPRIDGMISSGFRVFARSKAERSGWDTSYYEGAFLPIDKFQDIFWNEIHPEVKRFEAEFRDMLSLDLGMGFSPLERDWSEGEVGDHVDRNLDVLLLLDGVVKRLQRREVGKRKLRDLEEGGGSNLKERSKLGMRPVDSWTKIPSKIIARWESIMEIVHVMDAARGGSDTSASGSSNASDANDQSSGSISIVGNVSSSFAGFFEVDVANFHQGADLAWEEELLDPLDLSDAWMLGCETQLYTSSEIAASAAIFFGTAVH